MGLFLLIYIIDYLWKWIAAGLLLIKEMKE